MVNGNGDRVVVTVGDGPGVAVSVGVGVGVFVGVAGGKVDAGDGVRVGCKVLTGTGVGVSIRGRGVLVAGIIPAEIRVGISVGKVVAVVSDVGLASGGKVGTCATAARVGAGSEFLDPNNSGKTSSGSKNNTTSKAIPPTVARTKRPAITFKIMLPTSLDFSSDSTSTS